MFVLLVTFSDFGGASWRKTQMPYLFSHSRTSVINRRPDHPLLAHEKNGILDSQVK